MDCYFVVVYMYECVWFECFDHCVGVVVVDYVIGFGFFVMFIVEELYFKFMCVGCVCGVWCYDYVHVVFFFEYVVVDFGLKELFFIVRMYEYGYVVEEYCGLYFVNFYL